MNNLYEINEFGEICAAADIESAKVAIRQITGDDAVYIIELPDLVIPFKADDCDGITYYQVSEQSDVICQVFTMYNFNYV